VLLIFKHFILSCLSKIEIKLNIVSNCIGIDLYHLKVLQIRQCFGYGINKLFNKQFLVQVIICDFIYF
jgi:hypothetical protein